MSKSLKSSTGANGFTSELVNNTALMSRLFLDQSIIAFSFSSRTFIFTRWVLLCRTTFRGLAKWRKSKHKCSVLHKSSIEELNLNLALNPPFCQTLVQATPSVRFACYLAPKTDQKCHFYFSFKH